MAEAWAALSVPAPRLSAHVVDYGELMPCFHIRTRHLSNAVLQCKLLSISPGADLGKT